MDRRQFVSQGLVAACALTVAPTGLLAAPGPELRKPLLIISIPSELIGIAFSSAIVFPTSLDILKVDLADEVNDQSHATLVRLVKDRVPLRASIYGNKPRRIDNARLAAAWPGPNGRVREMLFTHHGLA